MRRRNTEKSTRKRRKPSVLDNEHPGKPTTTTLLSVEQMVSLHVKSFQMRLS